jgi:hypothetical protein
MVVPTRPCQESIGPRLRGKRSRANTQTSIGLYRPAAIVSLVMNSCLSGCERDDLGTHVSTEHSVDAGRGNRGEVVSRR